jgi:hypothetical protein
MSEKNPVSCCIMFIQLLFMFLACCPKFTAKQIRGKGSNNSRMSEKEVLTEYTVKPPFKVSSESNGFEH